MPNVFKFADWVAMRSLRDLLNDLEVIPFFNTDYNKEYTREFAVGETVRIKLPQRWTVRTGIAYSAQAIDRQTVDVTMDTVKGIDFDWDSVEQALKLERGDENIYQEYFAKAIAQLANEIDDLAASWAYKRINNVVGALGTNPTTFNTYHSARQRLKENACPPGKRGFIITPAMMNSIVVNNMTLFTPTDQIARAFKEGYYGHAAGADWYESNNLYSHTAGTWAGAVTVTSFSGSSLVVACTTGDTFKEGDTISIANVNNVNPKNRRSTGTVKHFVIRADATGAASAATLSVYPSIVGPGSQYQNVDALAVAGAALTLWPGTTSPSAKSGKLGFLLHRDAFAAVSAKMFLPKNAEPGSSQARDPASGMSIRIWRQADIQDSRMKNRLDVLLGFGTLYADNAAVRIASST